MPDRDSTSHANRVLIVSQSFYPSTSVGALRAAKFCKYLPTFGWTPCVLTTKEEYYTDVDEALDAEIARECRVVRTDMSTLPGWLQAPLDAGRGLIRRAVRRGWKAQVAADMRGGARSLWWVRFAAPDEGIPWIPKALEAGRQAVRDCRVVFSTYPVGTNHYVAFKLAKESGLPLIADFRDPWSFGTGQRRLTAWKRWVNRRWERRVVRHSRFVVCTTDAMTDRFRQVYAKEDPDKFVTIHNGFDPDDFPPRGERQDADEQGETFTLAYFGTLYAGRDPTGLLTAIRRLKEESAIDPRRFRLVLYGPPSPRVSADAKQFGLDEILHSGGFVSYREALRLMCLSSVLVVIGSEETDDLCVATKLYEYLYARRPILALVPPGPIRTFVEDHHAGASLSGGDVEGIARTLKTWYDAFVRGQTFCAGRELPHTYHRKSLTGKLANLLDVCEGNSLARHA